MFDLELVGTLGQGGVGEPGAQCEIVGTPSVSGGVLTITVQSKNPAAIACALALVNGPDGGINPYDISSTMENHLTVPNTVKVMAPISGLEQFVMQASVANVLAGNKIHFAVATTANAADITPDFLPNGGNPSAFARRARR